MKTNLLSLIILCLPVITLAKPTQSRLLCNPVGKTDQILIEYVGESDEPGVYQVIASVKIFKGKQLENMSSNARVGYHLEANNNRDGVKLMLVEADLGRTGSAKIELPNGEDGFIQSNIFMTSFNFSNPTPVKCLFTSHAGPRPALSGSN
ncbi:MAG: hypothetical protein ACOYOK_00265 [Pseudobdellovibrionaceae bacterium]